MANRVILNSSGLTISRPGVNVLTATDVSDLLFSSNYNAHKFIQSGTASLTSGGQYFTVNFGVTLNKLPICFVYFLENSKYVVAHNIFYLPDPTPLFYTKYHYKVYKDKIQFISSNATTVKYSIWESNL